MLNTAADEGPVAKRGEADFPGFIPARVLHRGAGTAFAGVPWQE